RPWRRPRRVGVRSRPSRTTSCPPGISSHTSGKSSTLPRTPKARIAPCRRREQARCVHAVQIPGRCPVHGTIVIGPPRTESRPGWTGGRSPTSSRRDDDAVSTEPLRFVHRRVGASLELLGRLVLIPCRDADGDGLADPHATVELERAFVERVL